MNTTFLVTIVLPDATDPSTLMDVAGDIEDDLAQTFEVVSVSPWARPALGLDTDESTPPMF